MIKTSTIRWPKKSKIWGILIQALETTLRLRINIIHNNNYLMKKIKRQVIRTKVLTLMEILKKKFKNRNLLSKKINQIKIQDRILEIKMEIKMKQIRINRIIQH